MSDTPDLQAFNPFVIPYQARVLRLIEQHDHQDGLLEILLSGSYGSAKSMVMAHAAVIHCLKYPKARVLLGRKSMPDLKDTILKKILDHIGESMKEGEDYVHNIQKGSILFWNGSEIICRSWADKKYRKLRSLDLSAAIIEEITENDPDEFHGFYKELLARVGRLASIPEKFILCATNPDAPSHPAYEHWVISKNPNRHIFYSVTSENPFLPPDYVEQLKQTLTAQEVRRYVYGEWLEIKAETVYYAYDPDASLKDNLKEDPFAPLVLAFDFNIGAGKPMSCLIGQQRGDKFLVIGESIIHGARTLDIIDDISARGWLPEGREVEVYGDATGRSRDTRSIHSDYDIIQQALGRLGCHCIMQVPRANPPVRTRHTIVNGQLKSASNITNILIDRENCKTLDKGLRLTKLKKGGAYIEDDSDEWQHCTTALGYWVTKVVKERSITNKFVKRKVV